MKLNEFLKYFLPDYEMKYKIYFKEAKLMCFANQTNFDESMANKIIVESLFNNHYFDEALQNFTDRICKRQSENCLEAFQNCGDVNLQEISVLNAKQPTIEEIINLE